MRYLIRFVLAAVLPLGLAFGLNPTDAAARPRSTVRAKPAAKAALAVRPGMELVFELPDAVRVVNPKPIASPGQRYHYGDTCHVEAGRRAKVIALTGEKAPRALLRLRTGLKKDSRFNCPADTLFFLPVKAIQEMLKQRQERLAREAAEKDLVRRLLRQPRSR